MLICSTVILGGVCMTCCFIGHRKIKHKKELASRLRDNICYLLEQGVATFLFGGIPNLILSATRWFQN